MPTTVHIPAALLKSVDRRARAPGVSRNRLIVRALEQAVTERARWAPDAAIAAHALASGATLVTTNLDHMARVPGLQIEDWSQ